MIALNKKIYNGFLIIRTNWAIDRNQKAREITPAIILFETIKTDELYNMYTV